MSDQYLVLGNKPWARQVFCDLIRHFPGEWHYEGEGFEYDLLKTPVLLGYKPRFIFVLHWSEIIPQFVWENYETVVFHMTPLPYGRGGSPLQNLIAQGKRDTVVTAFRMTGELDAGPTYMSRFLSLEGLAEEIYLRAMRICAVMIRVMISMPCEPEPQEGTPVTFKRRRPEQSALDTLDPKARLDVVHDHIRMLDAEDYPHAFIVHNGLRYEFTRPALRCGRIEADVTITKEE